MDKRGGIKIFRRKNFVSQCRKVRWESFTVALFSGIEKVWIRGWSIKIFRQKLSVSQCGNFCRGILYCCINFGYRKSLDKRGEYHDFLPKIFCLTVPKISVGESFTVAVISGSEKVYGQEGGGEYQDFPSKTFCLTVLKKFVGESLTVAVISGSEKVYGQEWGGEYQDFLSNIFVLQCRKSP